MMHQLSAKRLVQVRALNQYGTLRDGAHVSLLQKLATQREAVASAKVLLGAEVYHLVSSNSMKKGDVLTVRCGVL